MKLQKDFWGGSLMLGLGVVVTAQGASYTTGTLSAMGPGYFPVALGVIMALCGVSIAIKGWVAEPAAAAKKLPAEWRAWLLMCGSIVAFIVLARYLGLAPATFGLVFLSALADRDNNWQRAALLALAMVVIATVVFWWAFRINLPLFRWGIS